MKRISEETRIQQINSLPNIVFLRWVDGYKNQYSKAACRCTVDDFEWTATPDSLIHGGRGCPQCVGKRHWTVGERESQINAKPNVSFVRWADEYKNGGSKAVCRCLVDGFEWTASVSDLINNGSGCPQCGGKRRCTAVERIAQINSMPNVAFVRWDGTYKNAYSKAVCRCAIDGIEWAAVVNSLINNGSGCPQCAQYGYSPAKPGTLYLLRS